MSKLNIKENKKLVLNNVIMHEIRGVVLKKVNDEINSFSNKIDALKVQTFGPVVTKNYGTQIKEDGTMTVDYDVMIQAHDYLQYK